MVRPPVDGSLHDHAAATRAERAIDGVTFYQSPLAAGTPITIKIIELVIRILLRMLPPIGIVEPDSVRRFEVLFLHGGKELVHSDTLGIVSEVVDDPCCQQNCNQ